MGTLAVKTRPARSRLSRGIVSSTRSSIWLRLTGPIAGLAIVGSLLGLLFEDAIYGRETANWTAQAIGQDIANLVAFPASVVAAWFAARGSSRACLVWIGLLIYSSYTYAIYSFALHFGPLFLVWVAVFGLSVYALIGALAHLDVGKTGAAFTDERRARFAARLLIGIGSVFSLLWLSEIVPAMVANTPPETLEDVGLLTNPVHVLDLALLLPAAIAVGMLLLRRHPLGYVLAPSLLVATFFLALGIVSLMVVSAARGLEANVGVGLAVGFLALVEADAAIRLLRSMDQARGSSPPVKEEVE